MIPMSTYQKKTIQAQIRAYLFTNIKATAHSIQMHLNASPKAVYKALLGMPDLILDNDGYCLNGETRQAMVAENKSA